MAKNVQLTNTVTIANGGTVSTTLSLIGSPRQPLAIITPAALTGTTFTFQASADDVTYAPLYFEGTAVSIAVSTSRFISLDRNEFEGVKYLRIVSGSTEAAARTIGVVVGE